MKDNNHCDLIIQGDERQYNITLRAITKMDDTTHNCEHLMSVAMIKRITTILEEENTLYNTLVIKEITDKLLSYACEGAHTTICNEHSNDLDYRSKLMIDLIMIIINRYGGAISSQMLNNLLGKCDEYPRVLASLIDSGGVKHVTQNDGSPACFYIPNDDM